MDEPEIGKDERLFENLKYKLINAIYDAGMDKSKFVDERQVTKTIGKEVMFNFWDWLDTLPEPPDCLKTKVTSHSHALIRSYITGYLHDLEEAKIGKTEEVKQ